MFSKFLIFSLLVIVFTSCSTNTLDDVLEPEQEAPEITTFQDVKSIFENNCLLCHSSPPQNGAPMPLVSFENVRDAVLSRGLINRISRNEGDSGLMPLGGPRLPQTTINLIVSWEEDGLPEN